MIVERLYSFCRFGNQSVSRHQANVNESSQSVSRRQAWDWLMSKPHWLLPVMLVWLMGSSATIGLNVVTVTDDFASIARVVGGEHVTVTSLVSGSHNLHAIYPRPSMVVAVKRADLIIRIGMDQDSWIDSLIQVAKNKRVLLGTPGQLDCSDGIHALDVPTSHHGGRLGDVHKEGNPHYWLDPRNGQRIAQQIRDRLTELDPDNASEYQANCDQFCQQLSDDYRRWAAQLASLKSVQWVTYHTVWSYFFEAFGLTNAGQLEPYPGISPTTRHISALTTQLKESPRPTRVIIANFYPYAVAESFAKSINTTAVQLPTNVGDDGVTTYRGLFDTIIRKLLL